MQRWEYKTILQRRVWESREKKADYGWSGPWDQEIDFSSLGSEGWELVAVVPRSGVLGSSNSGATSIDFAGFTSEQLWVFKRPQE